MCLQLRPRTAIQRWQVEPRTPLRHTPSALGALASPWHANLGKRLVKSPKVYVRDSGLLHALLAIGDKERLLSHPVVGASREGFIIETLLAVAPEDVQGHFYRTSGGAEIDLVLHSWPPLGRRDQAQALATPREGFPRRLCRPRTGAPIRGLPGGRDLPPGQRHLGRFPAGARPPSGRGVAVRDPRTPAVPPTRRETTHDDLL